MLLSVAPAVAMTGRMIWMWKETVVTKFAAPSRHLPAGTEENLVKPRSLCPSQDVS